MCGTAILGDHFAHNIPDHLVRDINDQSRSLPPDLLGRFILLSFTHETMGLRLGVVTKTPCSTPVGEDAGARGSAGTFDAKTGVSRLSGRALMRSALMIYLKVTWAWAKGSLEAFELVPLSGRSSHFSGD